MNRRNPSTIAILGTLDTKGLEIQFVADEIARRGHKPILIDVGSAGPPLAKPDISREEVAAAGEIDLDEIDARHDRGECVAAMSRAASILLPKLQMQGRIDALISLGGGGGTSIGTAAMRALPIGFPKLMVSTLAGGDVSSYVGTKDIVMFPSVVDVAGLNRVSRVVFARAAGAICGMVETDISVQDAKPLIVASMFGNTTDCVSIAKQVLESAGYEVLVFHATGTGGRAMEDLIASGMVAGVLDITTTELADELLGGVLSAGPNRLDAAGRAGLPAVVTPGCLDMANFGPRSTVPEKYQARTLYEHNPDITLLRTNAQECETLGGQICQKLNAYHGRVSMMIPTQAISVISAAGGPFHDETADRALFSAIEDGAQFTVKSFDCEINSPEFAEACAQELLQLIHHPQNAE